MHFFRHELFVGAVQLLKSDSCRNACGATKADKRTCLAHAERVTGLEHIARTSLALSKITKRIEDVVRHVPDEVVDLADLLRLGLAAGRQFVRLRRNQWIIGIQELGRLKIFFEIVVAAHRAWPVCTENLIRVDAVMESPKLAE